MLIQIKCHRMFFIVNWPNIGSGNGLLPDGSNPLPEPMLRSSSLVQVKSETCVQHPNNTFLQCMSQDTINMMACHYMSLHQYFMYSPAKLHNILHISRTGVVYSVDVVPWRICHQSICINNVASDSSHILCSFLLTIFGHRVQWCNKYSITCMEYDHERNGHNYCTWCMGPHGNGFEWYKQNLNPCLISFCILMYWGLNKMAVKYKRLFQMQFTEWRFWYFD